MASVNIANVNPTAANVLSLLYLVTRILYNIVYVILQDNPQWGLVRSVTWFSGIGIIFSMFILAGAAVY